MIAPVASLHSWLTDPVSTHELRAVNGRVGLAGTLWCPQVARALILMHPGSGPSDRHNDVLFPPLRSAFLDAGVAVCSFDKRGVGGSSGSWLDADLETQAADLVESLVMAREIVPGVPVGLFGHSQGGWVVLAAASAVQPQFLITNSGPAMTPREQETYSTTRRLRSLGLDDAAVARGLHTFATVMDALSGPFDVQWPRIRSLPMLSELIDAGAFIPQEARLWSFAASIIDYDPRPALEALNAPLLALLGADDDLVPVQRSAAVFGGSVRRDLLHLRVVPAADHRFQVDGRGFVPGYLDTITDFVTEQVRRHQSA